MSFRPEVCVYHVAWLHLSYGATYYLAVSGLTAAEECEASGAQQDLGQVFVTSCYHSYAILSSTTVGKATALVKIPPAVGCNRVLSKALIVI